MPALIRNQVREIDRRAVEDYGMSSLVLMENAGRGCADVMRELGAAGPVAICCGKGNNGGDGMVIARHLDLWGIPVKVLLCGDVSGLSPDALANYRVLDKSGIPIVHFTADIELDRFQEQLARCEWMLDALLGIGAAGDPRPPLNTAIEAMNAIQARKLAIDLPSGLDCDTGRPGNPTFRADFTCAFVGPKAGFANPAAAPLLGQVHVVEIGTPRNLVEEVLGG